MRGQIVLHQAVGHFVLSPNVSDIFGTFCLTDFLIPERELFM